MQLISETLTEIQHLIIIVLFKIMITNSDDGFVMFKRLNKIKILHTKRYFRPFGISRLIELNELTTLLTLVVKLDSGRGKR